MAEFLINHRSRALLDLIDAFNFSDSELRDVWDGIFNRISEIAEIARAESTEAWEEADPFDDKGRSFREKPMTSEVIDELLQDHPEYPISTFVKVGFDDPMVYACPVCSGEGYIEAFEDHVEDYECPKCFGSGVLNKDEENGVEELVDDEDYE